MMDNKDELQEFDLDDILNEFHEDPQEETPELPELTELPELSSMADNQEAELDLSALNWTRLMPIPPIHRMTPQPMSLSPRIPRNQRIPKMIPWNLTYRRKSPLPLRLSLPSRWRKPSSPPPSCSLPAPG